VRNIRNLIVGPFLIHIRSQTNLDATYYITRVLIPPLERVFNLVGADIQQWFNEMPRTVVPEVVSPRKQKIMPRESPDKRNINEHFLSMQCLACGEPAGQGGDVYLIAGSIRSSYSLKGLCDACSISPQETIANLRTRIRKREERLVNAHLICATCTGSAPADAIRCVSLDCPWFYTRRKAEAETEVIPALEEILEELEAKWRGDEENNDIGCESPSSDDIYVVEDSE